MMEFVRGLLCPHCGILFFAGGSWVMYKCPVCQKRFKVYGPELLEACLGVE